MRKLLVAALLLLASLCGCTFSRTGQLFLSTQEDYRRVRHPPTGDRWIFAFTDPFVYVGCLVGMFTTGPASDILFLPYDVWLARNEGTDIAVVDERMRPIAGARVRVSYHNVCSGSSGETDESGVFGTGVDFSRISYGNATVEKDGYYPERWFWRPSGGENAPLGNLNVQTAVLTRVGHPVDLIAGKARFHGDVRDAWGGYEGYENRKWRRFAAQGGVVGFDFLAGDWLPPFGTGVVADVTFELREPTDREAPKTVVAKFPGQGNGVAPTHVPFGSGVLMRCAPTNGYEATRAFTDRSRERLTGLYFRIRGNVHGKIAGDFRVDENRGNGYYDKGLKKWVWLKPEEQWCTLVRFTYFVNEEPGNRNLEQRREPRHWENRFGRTGEP